MEYSFKFQQYKSIIFIASTLQCIAIAIIVMEKVHIDIHPRKKRSPVLKDCRYFCGGSFCFMSWCIKFFVLLAPYVCFYILVKVTEWPPIGKIAAHSAYDMFHGIST